uniref:Polyadenylate-binding protein-interacting protein 3 n=1 Tax=Globodera pallida TaxID=36090 RepID=A0A183BWF9_GLOPA
MAYHHPYMQPSYPNPIQMPIIGQQQQAAPLPYFHQIAPAAHPNAHLRQLAPAAPPNAHLHHVAPVPHQNLPHHHSPQAGQKKLLGALNELLSVARAQQGLMEKLVVAVTANKIGQQLEPVRNGNVRRQHRRFRPNFGAGALPPGVNQGGAAGPYHSRFPGRGSRFQANRGSVGPVGVVPNPTLSDQPAATAPVPAVNDIASTSAASLV